jgi:hypothetical protein
MAGGVEMSDRYETDEETAYLVFRSTKGREFLDINIDIDCPACPDDGEPFGALEITWVRPMGPYDSRGGYYATCPKCGYKAGVDVCEMGERRRSRGSRV